MSMHILCSQMQDGVGIRGGYKGVGGYTGVGVDLKLVVTTAMPKPPAGLEVDVAIGQGCDVRADSLARCRVGCLRGMWARRLDSGICRLIRGC
jgi:hypothetical protein